MLVLSPAEPFTILDANQAILNTIRKKEEDIIGKSIFEVFPDTHHDRKSGLSDLRNSLEKVIATCQPNKMPVQKFDPLAIDGNQPQRRYFQAENIPLTDEHGKIECILHISQEVTEKETAERQLKSTEKKLVAAQQLAKIGYWKLNIPQHALFWSDELYNILGVDKEHSEISYESFFQIIHPDDREAFSRARQEALTGVKEMDIEFRIVLPDGIQKWIHEKGKVERNEKGEAVTFEGTIQDITISKLLKLSLEETNERYYYASKATFDAIYDWNLISNDCYWGEGFTRDFGYTSELLNDPQFWEKHVHPDDKEKIEKEIQKSAEGKALNWLNEYRFLKADGSYAYILDRSIIIRNNEGKAVRIIGAMQDITEKKTLQQLLDKANRLAKIGSWEIDVESAQVYWSDIVKEIRETGKNYHPTLQDGISHFKEGYSKETILKRVKEAVKFGIPWQEDLQIYTHKGNLKWVRTIGKAEFVNGKCVKVYGSFQDIDEQKNTELEIRKLYEEKNTILESIGDGFFALDQNWIVTYWNKEAENMLYVPKSKVVGQYLWDVFPDSVGSVSYKKYHEALETNKQLLFEDYFPNLEKWFEITAYPSDKGLSVYFKDVTERKLSQIQLNELHHHLQKTAQNLAASNAELEQFAYIASHDLQEPLRMVTSFLSQLEKKYGNLIDDKGKQYIHFAVDGAKRMRQIILDLLDFSRVGKFNGKPQEVDTHKVAEEIITLYNNEIKQSGAEIQLEGLPVITTLKSPFTQVLQNLVSNALKYQKPGEKPVIKIAAEEMAAYWKFSVQDNGIGIDPDSTEKIFIIFQRLHHKDEYSGTGIGLAIVKKIVEAMGGGIWVEPNESGGSTFYFTINR